MMLDYYVIDTILSSIHESVIMMLDYHNATHWKTVLGPENIPDVTLRVSHNDAGLLCNWYDIIVNSWVCHNDAGLSQCDTLKNSARSKKYSRRDIVSFS